MRKIVSMILSALMLSMAFVSLAGCGPKDGYDITYATWNLSTESVNNIERRMIKAFEDKTGYKVKIEESVSIAAYDDSIKILAGKNQLPDVFMLSSINFGLSNEYIKDISGYVEGDEDWDSIPAAIRNAVYYGSGVYAVPFALNMMGYFINADLFEDHMVNELDVFPAYNDFLSAVKTFAAKSGSGITGLSHEHTIIEWYPASINEDLGWFTWDGQKYNLESDDFAEAMTKANEMFANNYTYDSLTQSLRDELFPGIADYVGLWDANRLAIRWGSTYEIPDMLDKGSFNIKFVGVPGGRVPVVGDYLGISPVAKKPDVAYEFAKWMSFDPEGIAKRMKLDTGKEFNTLPVTTDSATIDAYFVSNDKVSGLKEVFEHIDDGIIECVKVVPGYNKSRWLAYTGVSVQAQEIANADIGQLLDLCWRGTLSFGDYKKQINTLANLQYTNTVKEYEQKYN